MKRKFTVIGICAGFVTALTVGYIVGCIKGQSGQGPALVKEVEAAGKEAPPSFSPVKPLAEHDVYYPGTEALGPDEMRVVALGTGQPTVRPKQASACFLVELGNGDKFLFDLGYGSVQRLSTMKIPMDYLDKVFIGHLHMDHFGDLDALWIGGLKMNRTFPLRVWGPSGAEPEMGTKYAVEGLKRMLYWDAITVAGLIDTRGEKIEVTEFDYKGVNEVIYEANGVTIRSIPAIHVTDGAVSFILEWNGLKFAYSSDTFPNKWWIEHTKGADISIHECFASPQILLEKQKYPPPLALALSVFKHTSPQQFGKVMAMTNPRLAVGYHFYNDHDTLPVILEQVRRTYDGPLAMAADYMVFNVTKEDIQVRMAAVDTEIWPSLSTRPTKRNPPKGSLFSEFTESGMEPMPALIKGIYDDFNERNGTNVPLPK